MALVPFLVWTEHRNLVPPHGQEVESPPGFSFTWPITQGPKTWSLTRSPASISSSQDACEPVTFLPLRCSWMWSRDALYPPTCSLTFSLSRRVCAPRSWNRPICLLPPATLGLPGTWLFSSIASGAILLHSTINQVWKSICRFIDLREHEYLMPLYKHNNYILYIQSSQWHFRNCELLINSVVTGWALRHAFFILLLFTDH